MNRHNLRISCMEIMYQLELETINEKESYYFLNENLKNNKKKEFALTLFSYVLKNRINLIKIIKLILKNWSFERLGFIERSILLLGAAEILYFKDIPFPVSIDEWVEISKKYCGESSKKFINGVLNGIKDYFLINKKNVNIGGVESMYKIIKKEKLGDDIISMDIFSPEIAKKCEAGQFVIVRIDEQGERIPLTIADYDRKKGTITIVIQAVGYSSKKICSLKENDFFIDFVGPLGKNTEIKNHGTVVCIGGGVGVAPIFPIARSLKEAGNNVISIIGARSKDLVIWQNKLKNVSDKIYIATNDGSLGEKGLVTDILKKIIKNENINHIWAIGPVVMMKFVSILTKEFSIPTTVSMNPIMVDGTGMCGACRLEVNKKIKFACVDGPEFDGHKVNWELALKRMNIYKKEEEIAIKTKRKGEF